MKIRHYFIAIATAMLLSIGVAKAQLCPTPTLDITTGNITIPCATIEGLQLSLELELAAPTNSDDQNLYFGLAGSEISTCHWAPGSCATFDEKLELVVPLAFDDGIKVVTGLGFSPATLEGFYWQYLFHELINTETVVTLKSGTPNPKGGFESLYLFEGDFPHLSLNQYYDFQMAEGVIPPKATLKQDEEITLRIFHFNDLHHELRSVHSKKGDTHRFSQMVKIVNEARQNAAVNEIVLFMSGGDDHIGNPFDELLGFDADSFQTSAAYTAYSAAGLDASVIGNHELDKGTALLAKAIGQDAQFPVLSANLFGSKHLTPEHYYPALIGVANGLRIGIIGLTTQHETLIKTKEDPELDAGDLLQTLENTLFYVEQLSDVIILLTHVGYNGENYTQVRHELDVGDVQIAEAAAKMTNTPIVIIGGHLHLPINTEGLNVVEKSVPILEAGAKGSHLGEAVFSLWQTKDGLRSHLTARLIPLKKRDDRVGPDDPDYDNYEHDDDLDLNFEQEVMQPLYAKLDHKLQEVIGSAGSSENITTAPNIADRYVGETVMANFMNDAIVARSVNFPEKDGQNQQVDIAAFNATGVNGGVEPNSDITFNDWYSVMPYADMIIVTPMTGQQIKDMVMSNAQRIVRPEELEGEGAVNLSGFISRGFLHFSKELRYTIKLNSDATTTIAQDITLKGEPIDSVLDKTFNVAFSDYIALRGAEGWHGQKVGAGLPDEIIGFDIASLPKNDSGLVYRNEIIVYIKENGIVDDSTGAAKDGRIQVIP
ncbi:MAG: bifunctional metallophosphatase/5'-nucleotidase [Candidatus Parabeggiatoa sp. nov. 3]|nr:MAG: bifunctional metallophosphatase/5'-nucleotidase [Gammaproteobacteria bacterium]RKZ67171.1 MAG: bifunctional metallophosphatase/5'-nucleotidase [Gammaproteobacteria bacterium]RKZ89725.1 MAG: bifunctional metallophosphatase/5'-nucleotidase [Gammaproteobacteria bacterium]HEW97349.1 bifunctional metallophosphatase/5'-nucleotidase [Beggiatoa sp.]